MRQSQSKGREYVKEFPLKRLLPYYCTYLMLCLIYSLFRLIFLDGVTLKLLLSSLFWGSTVVGNGWYLQVQFLLYIMFYFSYRWVENKKIAFGILSTFIASYILFCLYIQMVTTWYESCLAFLLGIFWGTHKEKIEGCIFKKYGVFLISTSICFCVAIIGMRLFKNEVVSVLFKMSSSVVFCPLVILTFYKIKINNIVMRKIGNYSFGIYVMQGIPLDLFHSQRIYLHNDWLYFSAVLIVTLILTVIFEPIHRIVNRKLKGLSKKKNDGLG